MISWYIYRWRPIKSDLERKNKKNKKTLKKVLTYVFWFGIINKSSRETHKTTTTEYVMERYRSGHNEAVLKTVCPQGRVGSNPTLSVHHESMMSTLGEVPKWLKGLPWKGSRSLIAVRGFKSLLLRLFSGNVKCWYKNLKKVEKRCWQTKRKHGIISEHLIER